jgi:PAS domain S-box-containing protein
MQSFSTTPFLTDLPFAIALMDQHFKMLESSKVWNTIQPGQTIADSEEQPEYLLPPYDLKELNDQCLKQGIPQKKETKVFFANGNFSWFRWTIHPNISGKEISGTYILREDITERKKHEELLLKSQEVARIGGWEVDLLNNTIFWTDVTKKIHEVSPDYEPTLEEGIKFYKEGEDRERITELVSEAIKNGTPWDAELRIITAKGRELWVRAKGEVETADGRPIRICGTFQDIDKQRKADIAYKKVSSRLAIATEASNIGIWDLNITDDSLVWDRNMYRLYGIREEDFSGVYNAWESAVHEEDKTRAQQELVDAIKGARDFNTEFRVVWPSGEVRFIRAFGVIQKDSEGKPRNLIGTNWDITELKRTRLELDKSEESFQGAFDNSAIGMAMVALDGSWIKVNKNLSDITGYSEKELMKRSYLDITHPEDIPNDLLLKSELISGKRNSYQTKKRYLHKNGHLVHIIISVTGVKNVSGELTHVISQILNITKLVETEDHLKSLVEITKDQNTSLLNFAHIVSHNLRSHASNMTMLTDFLGKENDPAELHHIGRMLKDASESLNETVLHLNEVVQVKTGGMEKSKPVGLLDTIDRVKNNINALFQEKNASCEIAISEEIRVNAIPAYLESAFLNLFTNSLKYSDPNRDPFIKVGVEESTDGFYSIKFSDNGLGIDLDRHKDKVFGMYKTFHHHKEAKGIGLFITKNQVEAMNGKIDIESKVDSGTTFNILLEKA